MPVPYEVYERVADCAAQCAMLSTVRHIRTVMCLVSVVVCRLQKVDGPSSRLPTAATCFNTLRLPEHQSRESLAATLDTALREGAGFDETAVQDQ